MATILNALTSTDNVVPTDTNLGVVEPGTSFGYVVKVDSELMYVYKSDTSGKQLLVGRGVMGTTKAVHASGATITYFAGVQAIFTKTSAISDADYPVAPPIGTLAFDVTNFKIYGRVTGNLWKSSAAMT